MARSLCTFSIVILLAAFILQFLVSVSLPFLNSLDIVRVHFKSGTSSVSQVQQPISELRLGIWAFCVDDASGGGRTCDRTGHGYSVDITGPQRGQVATVRSSWTKGLVVHPVATGVIFVALLLSLSSHLTVMLLASLVSFLAALITFIAFAIDIALLALTQHATTHDLRGVSTNTNAGPGFWITLATFLLLLFAGCTVCFGRRRDSRTTYPKVVTQMPTEKRRPFWHKWRRNAY